MSLIGGNGAGKSTLLNCVSGAYLPTRGKILIDGTEVTNTPEYRRAALLGRVFQDPMMGTAGNLWIEENLSLALRRGKKRGLKWQITGDERKFFRTARRLDSGGRPQTAVKSLRDSCTLTFCSTYLPSLCSREHRALDPKTRPRAFSPTNCG